MLRLDQKHKRPQSGREQLTRDRARADQRALKRMRAPPQRISARLGSSHCERRSGGDFPDESESWTYCRIRSSGERVPASRDSPLFCEWAGPLTARGALCSSRSRDLRPATWFGRAPARAIVPERALQVVGVDGRGDAVPSGHIAMRPRQSMTAARTCPAAMRSARISAAYSAAACSAARVKRKLRPVSS